MISSFKDLLVWQEAMNLVVMIYQITSHFPRYEIFALTSQMNRAATSIPANISEGNGRYSTNDYLRFLSMANGSLRELEGIGASQQMIDGIAESIDSRYYFFDNLVGEGAKYIVMILSIVIFTSIFVLLNILQNMKKK